MSNTRTRRPSVATQNARLKEAGVDASGFTVKERLEAFDRLMAGDAPVDVVDEDGTTSDEATPAKPANFPLCGCGCGVPTVTAKARFLSGHDARFAGLVGRGEITDFDASLVTPALEAKIERIRETTNRKAALKAAKAAAKEAADAAYAAAMADLA